MSNFPAPPQPVPPSTSNEVKRQWYLKKRVYIPAYVVLTILFFASFGGEEEKPPDATSDTSVAVESDAAVAEPEAEEADAAEAPEVEEEVLEEPTAMEEPAAPTYTAAQQNAIAAAMNYVDIMPFSKEGLVRQLSSPAGDGYNKEDARFAVDHIEVDWKAEAVEAAENYQDIMPMSRDGLIQQLTADAGDKFTHEQAVYAVNKLGL